MRAPRHRLSSTAFIVAAMVISVWPETARADKGAISMELNKLESRKNACRVYMVFTNALENALTSFKPELVFFAKDGVIASRLVVEAGPLPAGKTKVKLFDAPGTSCSALGKLLLNGITACTAAGKGVSDCGARTKTSSLSAIDFIK